MPSQGVATDVDESHPQEQQEQQVTVGEQLEYGVDDVPPVASSALCGLQQAAYSISGCVGAALISAELICAGSDELLKLQLFSSFLVVVGASTFIQCAVGVRLPLLQGMSYTFFPPIIALMSTSKWKCPATPTSATFANGNHTNVTTSEEDISAIWRPRLLEIQGGLLLASAVQVIIGLTGIIGVVLRYIGPITITVCISLIGISLIIPIATFCEKHWAITALSVAVMIICCLVLKDTRPMYPSYSREKGCHLERALRVFSLYPYLFTMVIVWAFCAILTVTDTLPSDPSEPAYFARVDAKVDVLKQAPWITFPYPGQWGVPTVSAASFLGMLTAVVAGVIESVGDYYACARVCRVRPPPAHAVNRGVVLEGAGCVLAAGMGALCGVTTYSGNIGMIAINKVASRRVFYWASLWLVLCGILPKFGGVFTSLPEPLSGGVIFVGLSMVTAIGISNLQYVDLNSSRNLLVIGMSFLLGVLVPNWITKNSGVIKTGSAPLDSVLEVALTTSTFLGGLLAFVLDNILPGTAAERGLIHWQEDPDHSAETDVDGGPGNKPVTDPYQIPHVSAFLERHSRLTSRLPFSPTYEQPRRGCCCYRDAATAACRRLVTGRRHRKGARRDEQHHVEMTPNTADSRLS